MSELNEAASGIPLRKQRAATFQCLAQDGAAALALTFSFSFNVGGFFFLHYLQIEKILSFEKEKNHFYSLSAVAQYRFFQAL